MNVTAETEPDIAFVRAALPLLKEYTGKMKTLADDALEFMRNLQSVERGKHNLSDFGQTVQDELKGRFKYLKPPIEELIRRSSGVVEQGQLNGLEKIELWLRVAELEHNLEIVTCRIGLLAPKKS